MMLMKIRAVREDPKSPFMDCYDNDPNTLARLAVAKVMASQAPTEEPKKKNPEMSLSIRPLTSLPNRLDAEACLSVLQRLAPEWTPDSIMASQETLDIARIDSALAYTELNTSDRFRFKQALTRHGLISRGKRV
jgi:hypothetical protein